MQLKSLNNRQHGLTNSSLTFRVKTAQTTGFKMNDGYGFGVIK